LGVGLPADRWEGQNTPDLGNQKYASMVAKCRKGGGNGNGLRERR